MLLLLPRLGIILELTISIVLNAPVRPDKAEYYSRRLYNTNITAAITAAIAAAAAAAAAAQAGHHSGGDHIHHQERPSQA
jgi:ribosomal protein L12E/L44/L45/RPP1/RPP2